jgi:hypothetical protein
MWMCAAVAGPLNRLKVSRQLKTAPLPDAVAVAVNVPRAAPTLPVGRGTS